MVAEGPTNLDEFVNGAEWGTIGDLVERDFDGQGASDISSLDGQLGCSYDHSGALPAPARAQASQDRLMGQ